MKKFKTPMLLLIMSISLMLFSTMQPAAAKGRDTGPPAIHKLVFEKNTTVKTDQITIEVNCRDVDRQTIDAPITVTHADAGFYFTEFTFDKGKAVRAVYTGYHERSPEKVIINKTRPPNKV
jgi:hypothetical protein